MGDSSVIDFAVNCLCVERQDCFHVKTFVPMVASQSGDDFLARQEHIGQKPVTDEQALEVPDAELHEFLTT